MHPSRLRSLFLLSALLIGSLAPLQGQVTTPEQEFGFQIGADYQLVNYTQFQAYWEKLARESDRMILQPIGETEQGRTQLMAIITSPENHQNLDRYKDISRRLALAEGISESEARTLAAEGKTVIWIDGGLHATEVVGAHQLMELVYQMVSRNDEETLRFLDDVILLAVHCNPDGMELVSNWYMRAEDPEARSTRGIPVLYHEYAGHDNNRDSYMSNLAETENMNRVLYRQWSPQVVYNHHQTGPAGTILFAPPFRDPPNHFLDPLIVTGLDQIGAAMHGRFVQEGKGGSTMRSGARYSTWWNGGQRTTPYFHNMIGILTEIIGNPTPMEVPFLPHRQLTQSNLPLPVEPGPWHFRQSIDYSQTANRAILNYASRYRSDLLFNIWRMGMNSIERGSRDNWTVLPTEIARITEELEGMGVQTGGRSGGGTREHFERFLRDPDSRDARGYILPADQSDFLTTTKFVNALLKNGVQVHEATADFRVAGKSYPAGSYVVKTAQAFRPHVLDMFEAQHHPNDFEYPGGPPIAPYDNAGWTLALQMGVDFDRVFEGFDGPFEPIAWLAEPPAGRVTGPSSPAGYLVSHEVNDAFIAVNRVLAGGGDVYWMKEPVSAGSARFGPGAFYFPSTRAVRNELETLTEDLGLTFHGVAQAPTGAALQLRPLRIGLWDQYGGSMPSGWTRLTLEDFGFDFELVFPPELDAGNLRDKFDVLLFPDGAIRAPGGQEGGRSRGPGGAPQNVPPEYQARVGSITPEQTIPQLARFLEEGGTIITVGGSTSLAYHLDLPVENFLVEEKEDGSVGPISRNDLFLPGSLHSIKLEHVSPVTHGLRDRAAFLISNSPVFRLPPNADSQGLSRIGWFDSDKPLLSGWAWGQHYLENGTALIEADVGEGKLFLFGPRVTFRGQPHEVLPLFFNGMYYGTATEATLR